MKWIEEIKLRTAPHNEAETIRRLQDLVREIDGYKGLMQSRLYSHASIMGDFVLYLSWNTHFPETQGSPAYLGIKEFLKTLGLVGYSAWIEKDLKNNL